MTKQVFITGGSGFIGSRLCQLLLDKGHQITVFTRQPSQLTRRWQGAITAIDQWQQLQQLPTPDWVINLAGEPILDRPWSQKRRQQLRASRIELTNALFDALDAANITPEVIISGSAIGFYGDTGDESHNESDQQGSGFAAQLCHDWEQVAQTRAANASRLCILRTGIVLGADGGMLKRTLLPFKLGLGGKLGNGQQWLSWIALDDLCQLILFLLQNDQCNGIYNGTAPNPVRNVAFTQALGQHLGRPTFFTMPALLLKTLLGEAASLLLDSQRVMPDRAIAAGFDFQFPNIDRCLQHSIQR